MHPAADMNDRVMQEVNHHVKNNLQIVSSLLDLQMEFAGEKSTGDIIQTVKQRIQSMAILHDQLCNSISEGTMEISQYLKEVMDQTCVSFLGDIAVKAKISVEQCWISQQKLLLLGLVKGLVKQLRGKIEQRHENGVMWELQIPIADGFVPQ
ncbi:MAG: hypothetical protein IPG07_17100 [Crocinitomicaceae bacterium]|nr:hypothetical protein [Crocinitomicaceae bacterium]